VLGLLKLEKLRASIPEHALAVDLDMGFLFAIGPYGIRATDAVLEAAQNSSCVVRKNAIRVTRLLLDPSAVSAVRAVALRDMCVEARNEAWTTLGVLGDPQLNELVQQRLSSAEPLLKEEKLGMVSGLETRYRSSDKSVTEKFVHDPDPDVSGAAAKAIGGRDDQEEAGKLLANVGSKSSTERSMALDLLKDAVRTGRFDFEGTAFDLEAMLTPADLTFLNEARASVLRRASDECLHEWKKLYLVGSVLIQLQPWSTAPGAQ
jgi:HEAT repeat protein